MARKTRQQIIAIRKATLERAKKVGAEKEEIRKLESQIIRIRTAKFRPLGRAFKGAGKALLKGAQGVEKAAIKAEENRRRNEGRSQSRKSKSKGRELFDSFDDIF